MNLRNLLRRIVYFRPISYAVDICLTLIMFPILTTMAIFARYKTKPVDVGLGPEPLINNVYHSRALKLRGFSSETFVNQVYFITKEFDIRGDLLKWPLKPLMNYALFMLVLTRYKCIYIYFHGGPLAWTRLAPLEPIFLRIARVRIVVMPYGGDIQDLLLAKNLNFKHAMATDYPAFRYSRSDIHKRIQRWTTKASHVISGCDWVYYSFHWDTLLLGHFSIDTDQWLPAKNNVYPKRFSARRPLRLFHAPNHKTIKGTKFFMAAVQNLRSEGLHIELITKEKVPNNEIRAAMQEADVVLDQLVIGWYAMFALEAMSMEKPVICYLDAQLMELFEFAGIIDHAEIPIINANFRNIEDVLRKIYSGQLELNKLAKRCRTFVLKHHSLKAMGMQFERINKSLGVSPSAGLPQQDGKPT